MRSAAAPAAAFASRTGTSKERFDFPEFVAQPRLSGILSRHGTWPFMTALRNCYSISKQQMKLVRKAANDGEVPKMCPNPRVPQRRLAGLCLYAPAPQLPA